MYRFGLAPPANGLWVTTAGEMRAKYIIHLDSASPRRNNAMWTKAIVECLTVSDIREATSIAFPALGTGKNTALLLAHFQVVKLGVCLKAALKYASTEEF